MKEFLGADDIQIRDDTVALVQGVSGEVDLVHKTVVTDGRARTSALYDDCVDCRQSL